MARLPKEYCHRVTSFADSRINKHFTWLKENVGLGFNSSFDRLPMDMANYGWAWKTIEGKRSIDYIFKNSEDRLMFIMAFSHDKLELQE